jgi:hypothetical protein
MRKELWEKNGTNREKVTFTMGPDLPRLIGEKFDYCSAKGISFSPLSLAEINGDSKADNISLVQMGQKAYLTGYKYNDAPGLQKITFTCHHDSGHILALDVEQYGAIIARKGSFLVMEYGVKIQKHVISNASLVNNSGLDIMQRFSGKGTVFLEVRGDITEVFLHNKNPNDGGRPESILETPGRFAAMSAGVTMELVAVEDKVLRDAWGTDYLVKYTATAQDAYIWFGTAPSFEDAPW